MECGIHQGEGLSHLQCFPSSVAKQPCIIHDLHHVVFLVSAVYTCAGQHKLLAHDSTILSHFPSDHMVPFVLFSRTGFTVDLVRLCTGLCTQGMNFLAIERFIMERHMETYARQHEMVNLHQMMIGIGTEPFMCSFGSSLVSNAPSNNIISKVFLAQFLKDEQLYLKYINSIEIGDAISFDHTFKVVANIGYCRDDGTWVPQYDSLFIVMNERGKVLTWQLTKGTAFSQIGPLLSDLKERSPTIKTVYIDDCCKLRQKITSLLGDNTSVKLDLFHATKRITQTLCKKHPLVHQCTEDLRLVFREDGDSEPKRYLHTPGPDKMLQKFEGFLDKW